MCNLSDRDTTSLASQQSPPSILPRPELKSLLRSRTRRFFKTRPVHPTNSTQPLAGRQPPTVAMSTTNSRSPLAESLVVGGLNRKICCSHLDHNGVYVYFDECQEQQWELHYRTCHVSPWNRLIGAGGRAFCGYCSSTCGTYRALKEHVRKFHNTRAPMTLGPKLKPLKGSTKEIGRTLMA